MKLFSLTLLVLLMSYSFLSFAQDKNTTKGVFIDVKEGFYEEILKGLNDYTPSKETKKVFKLDFTGIEIPSSIDECSPKWHNPPISQGRTGTCWCFSTTSYFESEIYRIHSKKVKLSEIYTVYWEYVEKAMRFVDKRGKSAFGEGSEANAVPRIWKKYGVVPNSVYTGLAEGQKFHDHQEMFREMNTFLNGLKTSNDWNTENAVSTIKSILNHYLGVPPAEFTFEGKKYTPKEFLAGYVKLDLDDYVDILSLKQQPYYKQVPYEVEDNWWIDSTYYNVPLDVYMNLLNKAVKENYTVVIGGDVSEAGYDGWHNAAFVPSFDIPSEYINEDARQFRFSNGTTGDDHGIHVVGYTVKNGRTWFLIKDSSAGARNGSVKGYYFYDSDYVKLKMLDFMVHKSAVKEVLSKFGK